MWCVMVDVARGIIEVEPDAVRDEAVVDHLEIVDLLEPHAVAGRAAVAREEVVPQDEPLAVHEERPHAVVHEAVALDHVVHAVHEMNAVAPVRDGVPDEAHVIGVPDDQIAAVVDLVVLDERVRALPELDPVAPAHHRQVLPPDAVAADHAAVGPPEVDSEERVLDHVLLDPGPRRQHRDGGVLPVARRPGAAEGQLAHRHVGRLNPQDVPAAPSLEHRAPGRPSRNEREGHLHDEVPPVHARRDAHRRPRRRGVERRLQIEGPGRAGACQQGEERRAGRPCSPPPPKAPTRFPGACAAAGRASRG